MSDSTSTGPVEADVLPAFELLLEELEATVSELTRQAHEALDVGDCGRVNALCGHIQRVTGLRGKVVGLLREWKGMAWESPQSAALVARPAANNVSSRERLARGLRTPQQAYVRPILQALVELGGKGSIGEVLDRVYKLVEHQLRDVDLEPLPSSPDVPRWRNAAQWARQDMVETQLLRSDSPRGIWEITDAGRAHLAERNTP